jgi:hypothetical protein
MSAAACRKVSGMAKKETRQEDSDPGKLRTAEGSGRRRQRDGAERNFESHLLHEMLKRLGVSKTRTMSLHPQPNGMVERYIKTLEEHLRKVVASHQRDWDERLPLFLLDNRASNHDTTGFTPARLVLGPELRLTCDLLFGAPLDKERLTTDHAADLVDHLNDIHD